MESDHEGKTVKCCSLKKIRIKHYSEIPEAEAGTIEQRPIGEDDVCPICQDELLEKHLPVTYCKYVKLLYVLWSAKYSFLLKVRFSTDFRIFPWGPSSFVHSFSHMHGLFVGKWMVLIRRIYRRK